VLATVTSVTVVVFVGNSHALWFPLHQI